MVIEICLHFFANRFDCSVEHDLDNVTPSEQCILLFLNDKYKWMIGDEVVGV